MKEQEKKAKEQTGWLGRLWVKSKADGDSGSPLPELSEQEWKELYAEIDYSNQSKSGVADIPKEVRQPACFVFFHMFLYVLSICVLFSCTSFHFPF